MLHNGGQHKPPRIAHHHEINSHDHIHIRKGLFEMIPKEVLQHSIVPYLSIRDLLALLCLSKYYRNIVDDNQCWKELFYSLIPNCQLKYLESKFEAVWKSCLLGKISISKTSIQQITFGDVSFKKLVRNVFGRFDLGTLMET